MSICVVYLFTKVFIQTSNLYATFKKPPSSLSTLPHFLSIRSSSSGLTGETLGVFESSVYALLSVQGKRTIPSKGSRRTEGQGGSLSPSLTV